MKRGGWEYTTFWQSGWDYSMAIAIVRQTVLEVNRGTAKKKIFMILIQKKSQIRDFFIYRNIILDFLAKLKYNLITKRRKRREDFE